MKFDPRKPFEIWLDCFADVDKADRPTFTARRCTSAEWEAFMEDEKTSGFALVCKLLVGWKNQINPANGNEVAYNAETAGDDLRTIISDQECVELLGKASRGNVPSVEDKKKSA